jgi:hypothetical protein
VGVKLAVNRLLFVLLLLAGVVCPRVQAVVRAPQLENGDGAAAIAWSAAPGFAVQPAANAFAADCCGYVEWREGALRRQASGQWGRTDEAPGASCDYAARQDILAEPSIAAGATERNSLVERMAGWLYAELGQPPTAPPNCPAYVYDACRVFTESSFAAENAAARLALPHPKYLFKADQAVVHFDKHAGSIMNAMGNKSYNLAQYVDDANHVIQTGTWVPEMNGFVKFIGGQGSAKFGFVGLERGGSSITTFHIKTASELAKKAPSLGIVP